MCQLRLRLRLRLQRLATKRLIDLDIVGVTIRLSGRLLLRLLVSDGACILLLLPLLQLLPLPALIIQPLWQRTPVATALLSGIVAKIVLHPSGALLHVPLWGRGGALLFAIFMFFALKRRVIPAVLSGEAALIFVGWYFAPAG